MKLQHLVLHNIGPFYGRYNIDFTSESDGSGYAFFAENNRGKTSIYNAMRWCLFGKVEERAKTVEGRRYKGATKAIVGDGKILMNDVAYESDDVQEMSVILFAQGNRGTIQVTRAAKSMTKFARSDDEIEVSLNVKIGDAPLLDGRKAQEAIESFFPTDLARFFFIDGESLEEYTEMMQASSQSGLKDEVNAVLGIPALVRGDEDLTRLRRTLKSKIDSTTKAAKQSTKARDDALAQKRILNEKMVASDAIKKKLDAVLGKLEQTKKEMETHAELAPIVEEIRSLDTQIELKKANLLESAKDRASEAKIAWKVMLWDRCETVHDDLVSSQELASTAEATRKSTIQSIEDLQRDLADMSGLCDACGQPLPDLEKYKKKKKQELVQRTAVLEKLNAQAFVSQDELAIKVGDLKKLRPLDDSRTRIIAADEKWKRMKNDLESLHEQHRHLNSKLTEGMKEDIVELGERKGRQEAMIQRRQNEWKSARAEVELAELELNRLQRLTIGGEVSSEDHKLDNLIGKLIVTVKDTLLSYRESARKKVELLASETFRKMNNAPEVYTDIRVDKDFKTTILNSKGRPSRDPSSGAVSIMTMSVIDALRQVSGLDAPVFFDTPGRSLDEQHKEKLLEHFWAPDGQQFLIFAHSGEFTVEETLENFSGKMARAYTISLPGDHKTCYQKGCGSADVLHDAYAKKNTCNSCGFVWDLTSQHTLLMEVDI